jgi:hypothetical protein
MKKILITICLMTITAQTINAQSPWTREKGKSYVQLGFTGLFYNQYQFDGKKINDNHKYSDVTVQAYAEYGITNNLEATLILPYKIVGRKSETSTHEESLSNIGNITAGLKYKFFDKEWKISGGLTFNANSINKDENKGLSTGFNANTIIPYVSVGSSKGKWYYFGNLGYGYMDNDYSDFFKATFEVGYEVIKSGHLILVLDSRNVVNKEKAFENDIATQWPSYRDRQTYNAIGVKGNYEFTKDKYGANFAVFGANGIDNAPLAPTLNFGVYAKF